SSHYIVGGAVQGADEPRLGRADLRRTGGRRQHVDRLTGTSGGESLPPGGQGRRHPAPGVRLWQPVAGAGVPLTGAPRCGGDSPTARCGNIGLQMSASTFAPVSLPLSLLYGTWRRPSPPKARQFSSRQEGRSIFRT